MSDFNFPKDKTLFKGKIQNFKNTPRGRKHYSIDIMQPQENLITINNIDYYFNYLNPDGKNKGGNSIILKLYEAENFDEENIEYDDPDLILKILKFKKASNPIFRYKSETRFLKEIDALNKCKRKKFQNIIEIKDSGTCKIFNPFLKDYEEFLYYTMEYAEYDLKNFVEYNTHLKLKDKLSLCLSLSQGIKELKSIGYYHRDIKPDNIFITDGTWKIGDLGLVAERRKELDIDDINEFIGPRGWHSPEAMNKYLSNKKDLEFSHDCKLDHQSDIFQLGKVFWYILQNNTPTGAFKKEDFYVKNNELYTLLRTMLNYSKKRRYKNIDEVITLLKPIERKLQVAN